MRYFLVLFAATLATAQQSFSPRVIAVEGTPSQVLYATGNGAVTGILKSTNGGSTWLPLYVTEAGTTQPSSIGFAIDPANPSILYLATAASSGYFFKSIDGGATWAKANTGIPADAASPSFFRLRSVSGTALYLRLGDDLYKSSDQAATWVKLGTLPNGQRHMEISTSDPRRMYVVDAILGVHSSQDEGRTWLRVGSVPAQLSTQVGPNAVGILHSDPNKVIVSVSGCCELNGQGGYRSGDGGRSFTPPPSGPGLGVFTSFLAGEGPQIYAQSGTGGGFYISRDEGATWASYFNVPGIGVSNFPVVDPKNRAIVYVSSDGAARSSDAGQTWTRITSTTTPTVAKPAGIVQITLEEGAPYQQPYRINLYETETWALPYSVAVSGGSWLSLGTSAGNTPAATQLRINSTGMAAGVYTASIKIDVPQSYNKSVTVPVQLTVLPRGSTGPRYRISSVAGNGSLTATTTSGPALDIAIGFTEGIAVDSKGSVVFTGGDRVWKLTGTNLSVLAGTGTAGTTGDGGPASQATVTSPESIAINAQDDVFISERSTNKVRRISNGQIDAYLDRTKPGASSFFGAQGLAFDAAGQLILTTSGALGRFNGQAYAEVRGPSGTSLSISSPAGIAVGPDSAYYVSSQGTDQIIRVTTGGATSIYAGIGTAGFSGDGGPATQAQLNDPAGLAFDAQGTLYVADQNNHRIRAIRPDGTIRTIAGTGAADFQGDGSTGSFAAFNSPVDIAFDRSSGALYVSDRFNRRIRKLTKDAAPTPRPSALLHGASGNAKLSPGSLFSIYGELLASTTKVTGDTPWPRLIDGVSVLINGVPAPLYYVSPTQINGQIPYETGLGAATAIVTVNGSEPTQIQFQVVAANPGILVYNGNRAVAVNPNGSVNAPNAAAKPGEVELLYFSGIGIPDVPVATGEGSPVDPLARPRVPYEIRLNGQPVEIAYLGLAPGYPALCQANFTIPNLAPGDYELKMIINGEESNTTILTVGN